MAIAADGERRRSAPLEQASPLAEIRVDWLEAMSLADGISGRLGLTFLPGKHGVSNRYPGLVYERDLAADLAALRRQGVRHLLLLVDDDELDRWGEPAITEHAARAGIHVARYPLRDGDPPASPRVMAQLLAELRSARRDGDAAVACIGGVGRTGTVAACALVECGASPDDAIAEVRRIRHPDAVETNAQLAFVKRFGRFVAGRHEGPAG